MQRKLVEIPNRPPNDGVERSQLSDLIRRGLDLVRCDFRPRTWQAFWRTVVNEERTSDVAADLEMTANHVRQAKSRVLRRLRAELDGLIDS